MRIFSISDLHLSGKDPKPMDLFGDQWTNHWERILTDWKEKVTENDMVLIPGDISWAMDLGDAVVDLEQIGMLPGKKVIMKGNHDYWWSSITRVRNTIDSSMFALQNDCVNDNGVSICGTRGWLCPNDYNYTEHDMKIYNRELQRLRMSLDDSNKYPDSYKIVMFHFPPFINDKQKSGFVDIINEYKVQKVVYGHLHGDSLKNAYDGEYFGVNFFQVSCDNLDFKLRLIHET